MNPIGEQETGVGTGVGEKHPEKYATNEELPGTTLGTPPVVDEKGSSDSHSDVFVSLVEAERGHDIKLRTLSWQKTTILLFAEYVCLAIAAQAWSYSVLGMAGGLFTTIGMGVVTIYTSYVLWQYIMVHPEIRNVCDVAFILCGKGSKGRIAYEITGFMLLANNILLMGFHVLTGSKILNTLSNHSQCTVVFQVIVAIMSAVLSIPRTLSHVAYMSVVSAIVMFVAIILGMAFAGAEANPVAGYVGAYPKAGPVTVTAFAVGGTTFVDGLNAALNITFLWIGQILYPSFIAEMKNPRDFPKALAALSILEMILFTVPAIVGYRYLGQYAEAPMYASLQRDYAKGGFGPVIVPTVIIGVIYANPTAKFLYQRVMGSSRHAHSNSVLGWGVWIAIIIFIWALAFIFGEVIPSFGDFLSLLSAAFDSFFGAIFWSGCWFELNRGRYFAGASQTIQFGFNVVIFGLGLFMLGPGLYTSIEAIKLDYSGGTNPAFNCLDNSIA